MVPVPLVIHSDDDGDDENMEPLEEWRELQSLAQRLQNVDKLIQEADSKITKARKVFEKEVTDREELVCKKEEYLDRVEQLRKPPPKREQPDETQAISEKYDNLVAWVKSLQVMTSQGITAVNNDEFGTMMARVPLYEWQGKCDRNEEEHATQDLHTQHGTHTPDQARRSRTVERQRRRSASRSPIPANP